ncbi:MAG: twin-arginine translocation signal domain-containing protein, partial [Chitinophagaceae bacterium]
MNSRRDFLQKLTASAIALPLLKHMEESKPVYKPLNDGPVLRVAIMGLGSYGTRVADAMQSCKMAKL